MGVSRLSRYDSTADSHSTGMSFQNMRRVTSFCTTVI